MDIPALKLSEKSKERCLVIAWVGFKMNGMTKTSWLMGLSVVFYLATRLANLTLLPIFADEAIYIRWSQQMSRDGSLAFLPLYDGKTPLFMWLLVHSGLIDPLWSGRFTSVVVGMLTMWAIKEITKIAGGGKLAQWTSVGLYLIIPATIFHDRMALIDGLFVSLIAIFIVSLLTTLKTNSWWWALASGMLWGLVLLTKLPGLFLIPVIVLLPFLWGFISAKKLTLSIWFKLATLLVVGFGLFSITRFSEWFPFLFQRGNDFRYSMSELLGGEFVSILGKLPRYADWLVRYFGLGTLGLPILASYLIKKQDGKNVLRSMIFLLLGILLLLPFVLAGRIVYSRYFLPSLVFIIPAAALAAEELKNNGWGRLLPSVGLLIGVQGLLFMAPALVDPARIPLAKEDEVQYLTSWSSGHGVKEVVDYLQAISDHEKVVVASEGFFGTLPDGLFVYLDGTDVLKTVEIYGVGQPISGIPHSLREKTVDGKTGYILANEHRISFDYSGECQTVLKTERPLDGPPLLLLKCI